MTLRPLLLVALALVPSCITINGNSGTSSNSTPLSQASSPDGTTVTHKLHGSLSKPKILSTETRSVERSKFGVVSKLLEPALAERTGVEAWRGVWISDVKADSAAARAGLVEGDVLRTVNGVPITSPDQLGSIVSTTLTPGVPVLVEIDRWNSKDGKAWLERLTVSVSPDAHTSVESSTVSRLLEVNDSYARLTGLGVAPVSGADAIAVWGDPAPRWLVTGVRLGSPAYLSGLRLGDVIQTVDGRTPQTTAALNDAIAARIIGKNINTDATNAVVVSDASIAGRSDPIGFDVKGPLGNHRTDVDVIDDLEDDLEIYVPILFDYDSDIARTKWSFLDFIFQFGMNYETKYLRSATRAPAEVTKWSALPFGMFEYHNSPSRTVWTFLWFIDIETGK